MKNKLRTYASVAMTLLLSAGSAWAQSGTEVGHGGETIDLNGRRTLRDLVEGTTCRWTPLKTLSDAQPSVDELFGAIGSKVSWYMERAYRAEVPKLHVCQTEADLRPVASEDAKGVTIISTEVRTGDTSRIKQVAVRFGNQIFMDMKEYRALDEVSRAYLVFHEITHAFVPDNTAGRSTKVASFVSSVRDTVNTKMSRTELAYQMEMNGVSLIREFDLLDRYRADLTLGLNPPLEERTYYPSFSQTIRVRELIHLLKDYVSIHGGFYSDRNSNQYLTPGDQKTLQIAFAKSNPNYIFPDRDRGRNLTPLQLAYATEYAQWLKDREDSWAVRARETFSPTEWDYLHNGGSWNFFLKLPVIATYASELIGSGDTERFRKLLELKLIPTSPDAFLYTDNAVSRIFRERSPRALALAKQLEWGKTFSSSAPYALVLPTPCSEPVLGGANYSTNRRSYRASWPATGRWELHLCALTQDKEVSYTWNLADPTGTTIGVPRYSYGNAHATGVLMARDGGANWIDALIDRRNGVLRPVPYEKSELETYMFRAMEWEPTEEGLKRFSGWEKDYAGPVTKLNVVSLSQLMEVSLGVEGYSAHAKEERLEEVKLKLKKKR